MDSDTKAVPVHVRLLDEGTDVCRPTTALPLGVASTGYYRRPTTIRRMKVGNFRRALLFALENVWTKMEAI